MSNVRVFPFLCAQGDVYTGGGGELVSTNRFSAFTPDAEAILDRVLQPFGTGATEFSMSFDSTFNNAGWWPQDIIVLEREVYIGSQLTQLRSNPDDFNFTGSTGGSYQPTAEQPYPPIGTIFIRNRDVLPVIDRGIPELREAVEMLMNSPEWDYRIAIVCEDRDEE